MDLLGENPEFDLYDKSFPIMSNITTRPPHYIGPEARRRRLPDLQRLQGVRHRAALHPLHGRRRRRARRGAKDSVLLPGARVKAGAHVVRAILGENSVVEEGVKLGSVDATKDTAVVGNDVVIGKGE